MSLDNDDKNLLIMLVESDIKKHERMKEDSDRPHAEILMIEETVTYLIKVTN